MISYGLTPYFIMPGIFPEIVLPSLSVHSSRDCGSPRYPVSPRNQGPDVSQVVTLNRSGLLDHSRKRTLLTETHTFKFLENMNFLSTRKTLRTLTHDYPFFTESSTVSWDWKERQTPSSLGSWHPTSIVTSSPTQSPVVLCVADPLYEQWCTNGSVTRGQHSHSFWDSTLTPF